MAVLGIGSGVGYPQLGGELTAADRASVIEAGLGRIAGRWGDWFVALIDGR